MSYPYAETDPGENRQHYMYSAFGGSAFLSDYLAARQAWLDTLPTAHAIPSGKPPPLPRPDQPFDTAQVLLACALEETAGRAAPLEWARVFVRKIEVTRRLKTRYHPTISPVTSDLADADTYAYAAFVLARAMSRAMAANGDEAEQLRWLNALLKGLDCLLARRTEPMSAYAIGCAREAVDLEMRAVRSIAQRLGVALG